MIRNMSIRSKLIAILLTPLVALTVLASLGIGASVARGVQANRVKDETTFAVGVADLVHELQGERDLSAGYVGSGRQNGYGEMIDQRVRVNQALASFRNQVKDLGLDRDDAGLQTAVNGALAKLGQLGTQRQQIADDSSVTVQNTMDVYTAIIGDLISAELAITNQTDDRQLLQNVFAFAQLSQLKESVSYERGFMNAVLEAGRFGPGDYQRFTSLMGSQQTLREQFLRVARPPQRDGFARAVASGAEDAGRLEGGLLRLGPNASTAGIDPRQWYAAMSARVNQLREVERSLADDVAARARSSQHDAGRQALLYTIVLTVVLWLTVGLSLLLARSMVRPLRRLTETANEVAEERLPGLVGRLQQSNDVRDLDVQPEPVPVTSGDEIGQVSAAFNSVHRVAIQVATEQAALRRSIGDMFLNLARRSQSLIDRQLELIDDLERNEADPDALENLFRLDHLATRMRRNSEDLIVLSGAEPARRWSQPVPLVDVVRAALAEVEDYNRVELLPIDEVGVTGQAVSDVVHLLAELVENATSFSPPGTKVQVAGQQVSNGYVIEIEDRGLGMSDEELVEANERLANPPTVDFALARMLGLYVVGRLAQRYGIKVQLRHSWYGGVTALVLLPAALTVRQQVAEVSLEAGEGRRGPAELTAPVQPAAPPGSPSGDHLPIFEAARSDWFESGVGGTHLPLRRHAAQQPNGSAAPTPTANGVGRAPVAPPPQGDEAPRTPPPAGRPEPAPPPQAAPAAAAPDRGEQAGPPPAAAPAGPAEAPPVTPASLQAASVQTTKAGLPRRVPRANLAPGMVAAQAAAAARPRPQSAPSSTSSRSPEEVRSMLSSYRSGLERGRMMAAGDDQDRPAGGDVPTSPRSDDDATE
jgi:HAMP domain-containing protein